MLALVWVFSTCESDGVMLVDEASSKIEEVDILAQLVCG